MTGQAERSPLFPAIASGVTPVRGAWVLCLISLSLLASTLALILLNWSTPLPSPFHFTWGSQLVGVVGALGPVALGGLIATYQPNNRYGLVWCCFGLSVSLYLFAQTYVAHSATSSHALGILSETATITGGIAWLATVGLVPLLLLLFPNGRVPSRLWRFVVWTAAIAATACAVLVPFLPDESPIAPVANPMALDGGIGEAVRIITFAGVFTIFGATILAAISLIFRFRRADSVERQQIKWVAYSGTIVGLSVIIFGFVGWDLPGIWDSLAQVAAMFTLYLAVAVAIQRYRLYDIDLVINRTLVYSVLTAGVVGIYVMVVGYLSAVLQTSQNLPVSLIATGLVAVLFQPMRERVQQGVNRLLYGQRDDPYGVVTNLGRRMESTPTPDDILPTIVYSVREALKLSYVAIVTNQDNMTAVTAESGTRAGVPMQIPLSYGNEPVGELWVSSRGPGESLSDRDRRLLEDVARHVGVAVHAAQVTVDLQRSRERLVMAQEEERRRIQRNLHDGLGPILASMRLRLEGCLEFAHAEGSPLVNDLKRLHELLGQASGDIRSLVYDLRPPVLDQIGLVPALRQHVEQFGRETGIATSLDATNGLCTSAATEVAVLRIVQEALVNVQKHARARQAIVRLIQNDGWLALDIEDDGTGFPINGAVPGAGLVSIRERTELLGGTFRLLSPARGGVQISVRFPIERAEHHDTRPN